jgi:hypothetical protein
VSQVGTEYGYARTGGACTRFGHKEYQPFDAQPYFQFYKRNKRSRAEAVSPQSLSFNQATLIELLHATPPLTDLMPDFPVDEGTLEPAELQKITHSKLESIYFHPRHCVANGYLFGVQIDAPSLRNVAFSPLNGERCPIPPFILCGIHPRVWHFPAPGNTKLDAAELFRWYPKVNTLELAGPNVDTLFVFMHTLFSHIPLDPTRFHFPSSLLSGSQTLTFEGRH